MSYLSSAIYQNDDSQVAAVIAQQPQATDSITWLEIQ